jgi:hypothetical protein
LGSLETVGVPWDEFFDGSPSGAFSDFISGGFETTSAASSAAAISTDTAIIADTTPHLYIPIKMLREITGNLTSRVRNIGLT